MNKETKEKKILHKVKKNWVVIGMATVSLLGAGYTTLQDTNIVSSNVVVHADTLDNQGPVNINIDKNNFNNYFDTLNNASYNQENGVITLTTDNVSQSGGVSLKNKISMNRSFDLKGSIYLGDKTDIEGGADGLAIFLHPNSVKTAISSGASVGMWGIPNAVGFKLDTFYNHGDDPLPNGDNAKLDGQGDAPFGAFTYTDGSGNSEQLKNESSVQFIQDKSSILNKDAQLLPFDFSYNASTKQFTVTYDNQTWTKTYDGNSQNMVLVISAATGLSHNLQQVQLDSFSYSADPIYLSQQSAMDQLKNTATDTTNKINNDDKLTNEQKNDQNQKVSDELQKAYDNVQQQTTSDGVTKAQEDGKKSIENQYVPGSQLNPESSSAQSSSASSSEQSSTQSSAESSKAESSAQSSTENSSAQSSAESSKAESSAQSSAENSSAQSSAESSKAESSAQSSTENSSAQSSAESSNAESSAQSSTENSSAQSSAESSKAESSAQSSAENSSTQSSSASSSAQSSAESSKAESSAQSSAQSSAEHSSAASSAQSSTEHSSAQSSAESSKAASSAQSSAENSSAQSSAESSKAASSSASTHETRHHESNASNSLANNKDAKRLPQTGDQTHENVLVAVGTILIALALGLAFVASRRRRKH
ncbi:DUF1542 domain-containing protein [Lactobacillus sp. B3795]|uniref:lectin-like domain-containing protein n=1 Tax=Lactobacillus sp. B3795 TaxID=2818036 RepID=UPI00265D1CEF|nr:DUF1542 domain-containing protein [Lactobacillus sp. B3795]MCX8743569.1 DUF1542 domain-containing protein [Lactobacillus sp. B3795]